MNFANNFGMGFAVYRKKHLTIQSEQCIINPNIIALNTKKIKLQVSLKYCNNNNPAYYPITDEMDLKIILYKPDGTRIEKPAIKETLHNIDYLSWNEPYFVFDVTGAWRYVGYIDVELPIGEILRVL